MSATPYCFAKLADAGSCWPGLSVPRAMRSRRSTAIDWYFSTRRSETGMLNFSPVFKQVVSQGERQFLDFSKHTLVTAPSEKGLRFDDIAAAAHRLRGVAICTPVVRDDELDALAGNALFF